jgi:DNA mismatch endonuclease (patch repair protein)
MTDIFSKEMRSEIMSRVRPRGNKTTELTFLRLLREAKIKGWRRHVPIIGRPDFMFHTHKVAIFLDGCFWHGCLKCRSIPKENRDFWKKKFDYNRKRARTVNSALTGMGWKVIRFWEHELKDSAKVLAKLARYLN